MKRRLRSLIERLRTRFGYRPEQHYMRGPGPASARPDK